ncbi:MAG TPA: YCF48-related protein [Bryobacteraceae bacterium]|nr:YCF48-related protein [Bryobacteraceae bacterium]
MPTWLRYSSVVVCLTLAAHTLRAHDPHDAITVVAMSPNYANDQTVMAATASIPLKPDLYILFMSTDGGLEWSVSSIPTNQSMSAIAFSPAYSTDGTIFVAGAGGLFRSTDRGQSWTPVEAAPLAPGTALSSIVLSANFNYAGATRTMFAASTKTIYKSMDGGTTWSVLPGQPSPLTSNLTVLAVAPDPGTDQTLVAGTAANGIFESANGGPWTQVTSTLTVSVTALAFSPAYSTDRTIFAGTYGNGVWVSRSGGVAGSWKPVSLADNSVTAIALSQTYSSDGTLWASTADKSGNGGVFQSTNRGSSWTGPRIVQRQLATNQTNTHYQTLATASGASTGVLFLGMFEGLWTMPANGASWQYVDLLPTHLIRHVNLNSAANQTVFATSYGGGNLWSSTAGTSWNTSWTYQNTGMMIPYTDASALSPNFASDGIAFSGVHSGLQETTNGNAAQPVWNLVAGGLPGIYPRAFAMSPSFATDQTIFAGTASAGYAGLWRSTTAGASWTYPGTLAGISIVAIALPPTFNPSTGTAFAASDATTGGGLYKSTDGGATWQLLTSLASAPMGVAAVSPNYANDQTLLAAYVTGGVMESHDGGTSWTAISGFAGIRALDIQFSPNYTTDQTFYVGTVQEGLVRSTAGALTQTALPDNLVTAAALAPDFNYNTSNRTLFAASYHGLYKSQDGGSTWTNAMELSRTEESRSATDPATEWEPPAITYGNAAGGAGSWTSVTNIPNASTRHYMKTTVSGDTAVFNFIGSGVTWLTRVGPGEGTATIQLNGAQYNINLANSSEQYQYTVWTSPPLPCGPYTLTLTATPQSGKDVSLDAFQVTDANCSASASVK